MVINVFDDRIQCLNDLECKPGKYILYWMQQSQRIEYNHALKYAIERANVCGLPLLVAFVISPSVPGANWRHYNFMLEGIAELIPVFRSLGIGFHVYCGDPVPEICNLSDNATEVIMDRGYLKWQKELMSTICGMMFKTGTRVSQVESDVCIPVMHVSPKEEYAAYSIRPKIVKMVLPYLQTAQLPAINHRYMDISSDIQWADDSSEVFVQLVDKVTDSLVLDRTVSSVKSYIGGYGSATKILSLFCAEKLNHYSRLRNNPGYDMQSNLSPYLHFGQISVIEIVLKILKYMSIDQNIVPELIKNHKSMTGQYQAIGAFLEELIVRRELSINFCEFNSDYDSYECVPIWARNSLESHRKDKRAYKYSLDSLERADTHDDHWNTAQKEMVKHGKMHNYMRMYWGKKIIEWSADPEEAFYVAQYLNDKYELDGRDPNSYAGIAWCFGKHDRPWKERPIFGMVRYMNSEGLDRKFDMKRYSQRLSDTD